MKRFIRNVILITVITPIITILLVIGSTALVKNRNFENWQTESNTLFLKENAHYDIAFLGISHARNFSRDENQLRVEDILNKKVLNLGQGYSSCGVNDQQFYLEYYYSKNVKIDTIVYVLSPPLLYGEYFNTATSTFLLEPFDFDFFRQYYNYKGVINKSGRLIQYVSSKLHPKWLFHYPLRSKANTVKLLKLDTAVVNAGFRLAYLEGENLSIFTKNCNRVEMTIEAAKANNSFVIFIIPPALFGKWKGHNETMEFCKKMQEKHNIAYYDFSESVLIPAYYYDHHHLNSDGVTFFTKKYLAPIFASKPYFN